YKNQVPFKNVYFTGIVRDLQGRKMSKTLGNSPDPLGLIDEFGADGVRVGMLLTAPAGNDLPFDPALVEQGRNFSNKIWNALRLLRGWEIDSKIEQPESSKLGVQWFEARLNKALASIEGNFDKYRISDALMETYKLIWDDFCSWYLEIVKPAYQQPIDAATHEATVVFFEKLMKILHPFMPFITEEIWHLLRDRKAGDDIIIAKMPVSAKVDKKLLAAFDKAEQIITGVRTVRKEKNILNRDSINLIVKEGEQAMCIFYPVVAKLGNIEKIEFVPEKPDGAVVFTIGSQEFYIPLAGVIDIESEISKLTEELNYTKGFLTSVMKKLSNERFVSGAPKAVVNVERKKQADAEARIAVIEEQLASLRG
ncbi:MAG TPA: class I tRNA ligase family protein, partial [Bacteroidales bacterium]